MTEREIFLAVLDLPETADRTKYLDKVCGDDQAKRARVESLLKSHDAAGSFLGNPAVKAPVANGDTQELSDNRSAAPDDAADELHFLAPTTRPDSLGRLGHYEVLQVLGKGGFGIVFRAFDDILQRVVAIKVMAPQIAALSPARRRFVREARSSAAVRHENVVQIYEVGDQPLPYLTMEFIPGETLQQKLDRSGPLDVSEILWIGRQIAEGLAAAHACDLIHRDIKPGNVLLEGGSHKVKITDFGLARAADDASISQSGIIAGTPMFMAPEQALGHHIDQRADLFSLGSVLYQMASGRPPFRAPTALAVLKRVAEETPRPIPEIIPETPDWLCGIIAKLHAKKPDERFQSAREVAELLADCEAKLKAKQPVKYMLPGEPSRVSGRVERPAPSPEWIKWAAAAVLLLPVIALAATEFAGVTQLFRQQVTPVTGPVLVSKNELPPLADGWVRLFNGKDLSGWKTHDRAPGNWRVEDGAIVGRGDKSFLSFLFSESEYADFHLLVEAKINAIGDSGVIFRAPFDVRLWDGGTKIRLDGGYEAQIAVRSNFRVHTGSLFWDEPPFIREGPPFTQQGPLMPHRPDEWFVLEVIAQGNRIQTFVNGKKTVDYVDEQRRYDRGHLALQTWGRNITFVQFRKIEIKELPSTSLPPTSLPPTFKNSLGMEFVIVPKGKSWLGWGKDKLGYKEVEIPADFYLGKYEVTQEEWEKVMGENPSHFSRTGEGKDAVKDISDADLKRFPVENVSWDQCQIFVAKLNKLEKESGWVYRLPKQTEWEYACRGGPVGKLDGAFYHYFKNPTNTLLLEQANFSPNNEGKGGLGRTCKVGSYEPNRLGLNDMQGNVWELCEDVVMKAGRGPLQVSRGGSWFNDAGICRAGGWFTCSPWLRNYRLGLRLARIPSGAPSPEAKTPPLAVKPFTDGDVKRIAALPAADQVEEVRKELMKRNPGFDGKVETKIEGDVVTEFRIVTDNVTDVAPLRAFNALRVLDLYATHTDTYDGNGQLTDLSPLAGMNLAGLTRLNLSLTRVGDAGLVHFKDCTNLTYLNLDSTQVSDAGLAYFKNCTDLSQLLLGRTKVNDAGLAHFKNCKKLTLLDLSEMSVGDAELGYFKECENLTRLGLGRTRVTDAGLAHFKNCKNLQHVNLLATNVGNEGLAYLKDCKALTGLFIGATKVTDLSLIKDLPLKELDFDFRPERDAEILRSIKTLEKINGKSAAEFWKELDERGALAPHITWLKAFTLLRLNGQERKPKGGA